MKKIIYGENKNLISKNLKIIRIARGLTQSQLAAKMQVMNVNIDQQMISKIENNSRFVTDYELACICLILKVELKSLVVNETISSQYPFTYASCIGVSYSSKRIITFLS